MHRIIMALGLLLLAVAPAGAQQVTSIEIVKAGIFTADNKESHRGADGIDSATVTNLKFAVATTTVPLQRHIQFGVTYHITGTPAGASVPIREVIVFPAPGLKPPGKPALMQSVDVPQRKTGVTSYSGYSLDEPFELVPGRWTFQLWWNNRKLAEQSFMVVAH